MFCRIIPKLIAHKDICEISDDHNPGAFNAFKHCGKKIGALCLLLDVLKGFVPVLTASLIMDTASPLFTLVMIAPVLGHAVGLFNGFHGGKCIAVSFGVMFGILPVTWVGIVFLAAIYIIFSTVIKINPNAKRSIVVYTIFGICSCILCAVFGQYAVAAGCAAVAVIAIIKHLMGMKVKDEELQTNER